MRQAGSHLENRPMALSFWYDKLKLVMPITHYSLLGLVSTKLLTLKLVIFKAVTPKRQDPYICTDKEISKALLK